MGYRDVGEQMLLEKMARKDDQHRVASNLQFVKNTISMKCK